MISINSINKTKIKLLCNWTDSENLKELWNKMTKGNYTWNNIEIVTKEPVDFYVIINSPPKGEFYNRKKTIVFQMEPHMEKNYLWGEWGDPVDSEFFKVLKHRYGDYNNNEWHLSLTWNQLHETEIKKSKEFETTLSTILSNKKNDIGQKRRCEFINFLETKNDINLHIYGDKDVANDKKNYMGNLPHHKKDAALFPYKYNFNCENNQIAYYYTEKLIDGILSESLTFYCGCPNITSLIDPNCYVILTLEDFESDYQTIKKTIKDNLYEERIDFIKKEKKRILDTLQFFPRLEKIIYN